MKKTIQKVKQMLTAANIYKALQCARYYYQYLIHINSFNPYNNLEADTIVSILQIKYLDTEK